MRSVQSKIVCNNSGDKDRHNSSQTREQSPEQINAENTIQKPDKSTAQNKVGTQWQTPEYTMKFLELQANWQ